LGINVLDHISQILVTISGLKILKFLVSVAEPDPGSGGILTPRSSNVPDPDPAFHFDADPDPAFYSHADPDPDPASQNDADPCGYGFATLGFTILVGKIRFRDQG
jgi:hypothetical protein